ncbi:MAG: holo-[acyl-carrier-protein] synthase [Bacteroidetes bacterium]|nr:holo-[acyl-carrier-protein] synthase [Bacteroidota bacterium]
MRIGVDIVEISRIAKFLKKLDQVDYNKNLSRIFSQEEIVYCLAKKHDKNRNQSFAVRFAAKEAVIKALDDKKINLRDIFVTNLESGKPHVHIKNKNYQALNIEISLSHSNKYAIAMVIIF